LSSKSSCEDDGVLEGSLEFEGVCEGTDEGRQSWQRLRIYRWGSDDGAGEGNVDGGSESFDGAFAARKEAGN
jgi:hypothetical protein